MHTLLGFSSCSDCFLRTSSLTNNIYFEKDTCPRMYSCLLQEYFTCEKNYDFLQNRRRNTSSQFLVVLFSIILYAETYKDFDSIIEFVFLVGIHLSWKDWNIVEYCFRALLKEWESWSRWDLISKNTFLSDSLCILSNISKCKGY